MVLNKSLNMGPMHIYHNESNDIWVCTLADNKTAFVAMREGEHGQWALSYRKWITNELGESKLRIKPLGKFDDLYKAQEAVGINLERASIVYNSSIGSLAKTEDIKIEGTISPSPLSTDKPSLPPE
jgi:hypothetical protein